MGLRHAFASLPVLSVAALGGCVSPGRMPVTDIVHYQRAMAERAARAAARGDVSVSLDPAGGYPTLRFLEDQVVERQTRTTRVYEGKIDPEGSLPRDRARTTIVVTEFDLDPGTGQANPASARIIRRSEIETTRTFRPQKAAGSPEEPGNGALVRIVEKRTDFARDPATGKLRHRAKTLTTSTYRQIPGKAGEGPDDVGGRVEVTTNFQTMRDPRPTAGDQAKPASQTQPSGTSATSRISLWEFRKLAGTWTDSTTSQSIRAGRSHGAAALLTGSRKLLHLRLEDAILGALAMNPNIRVVSFLPAVSREEMARAAAFFDYAVFYHMYFFKMEDEADSPLGLYDAVQRARNWSVGLRQMMPTGTSWTLRASLSRNWDGSVMDGLYKSVAALEVTQPLLRGAGPDFNLAALRVARVNHRISHAQFRVMVEQVITDVTLAYWELVQARRSLQIKQRFLQQTRQTHEEVKVRRKVDATLAAVKQAEVAVKTRQAELIDARKWIQDVQDRLAHLVADPKLRGTPSPEIVPVTPPLEERLRLNAGEQLMTAVRHNPLLEQARLGIAAAEIDIALAENETLPILNLYAAVERQGFRRSLRRDEDYTDGECTLGYRFDLMLDYPIGNRAAMARLRQARFTKAQAIATVQQTVNDLALEISQHLRTMRQAYEKIQAYRSVAEVAAGQLQALKEGELRGQLTPGFLRAKFRAQRDFAEAGERVQQAVFDYNSARAQLNRVTGTILDLHRVRIALPAAVETIGRSRRAPATLPATRPVRKP